MFYYVLIGIIVILLILFIWWISTRRRTVKGNLVHLKSKLAKKIKQQDDLDDYDMAQIYHVGTIEYPKDVQQSMNLYHRAIKNGHLDAYGQLGRLYHEMADGRNAIKYYNLAVQNGEYKYLLDIGDILRYGLFGDSNFRIDLVGAKRAYAELNFNTVDDQLKVISRERLESMVRVYNDLPIRVPKKPEVKEPVQSVNEIRNDLQNVHDTVVQNGIKNLIKDIPKCPVDQEKIEEMRHYILECTHDKKEDALKSLDKIENVNAFNAKYNMTEKEALTMVWNKCIQDEHKDLLVSQLIEMVEKNNVVCAVGRIDHVFNTLSIIENKPLKTRDLLVREMMERASSIRQDMINALDAPTRHTIESSSPSKEQEKFTDDLKLMIRKLFEKDYVETGLLTQGSLNVELDKWIEYI